MTALDPEKWVEGFFAAIKDYVTVNTDALYDVRFSFPGNDLDELQPPPKTIIHFEIDDHENPKFGFGENVVDGVYDDTLLTTTDFEAQTHMLNLDVGIWASQKSGGVNARLKAFQHLVDLFCGPSAFQLVRNTYGFEIVSFDGGSFVRDSVADIPLWRVAGMTLIVRIFGKKVIPPAPYIADIILEPGITIQDTVNIPITG